VHQISDPNALARQAAAILDQEMHARGWTQTRLSKQAGMNQSTVGKYLRGDLPLGIRQFDALCHALNVNPGVVLSQAHADTLSRFEPLDDLSTG
jgi:transcriptional regulator with XRE-family HTH domain